MYCPTGCSPGRAVVAIVFKEEIRASEAKQQKQMDAIPVLSRGMP